LVPPKSTILCVDDEPNALMLRRLVLEKAGFNVVTAPSSAEALHVLSSTAVDLVLSDQLMPGGTGTDLARQVKELHPNLPFIIISGVNELPPDSLRADLFLSKVEGPVAMCEKISGLLERFRQQPKPGE
jgi:two-component system, OmpR family, response regulator CpxR